MHACDTHRCTRSIQATARHHKCLAHHPVLYVSNCQTSYLFSPSPGLYGGVKRSSSAQGVTASNTCRLQSFGVSIMGSAEGEPATTVSTFSCARWRLCWPSPGRVPSQLSPPLGCAPAKGNQIVRYFFLAIRASAQDAAWNRVERARGRVWGIRWGATCC